MRFEKWQALGNDYMIVEHDAPAFELTPARIEKICRYHFGAGADGILLIEPPASPDLVANVRIFNPDGSEAELSGNGIREAIMYLRRAGRTDVDEFAVGTAAGVIRPKIVSYTECEVDMGRASVVSKDFPDGPADGRGTIAVGFTDLEFQHVSIGNPQCAIEIPGDDRDLTALALGRIGPGLETDHRFPNRTNVSFWQRTGDQTIRARIFERGVGETLSSGTGATGAAVAAFLRGMASPIAVELDGGELLVAIDNDLNITLTGWAKPVFAGELSPEFITELENT
ncbi:MAG: diaminopimelate epimerase [Actinobacteria bacterium]|nr:diaminopimelate epimerase [Actinomycetota bacterium]